MTNIFKKLQERINLLVYDSKRVLYTFRYLTFFAALFSLCLLAYYYGFEVSPDEEVMIVSLIKGSFFILLTNFVLRLFYSLHRIQFIKQHWFESILMSFLIFDGISGIFFMPLLEQFFFSIGMEQYRAVYILTVNLYMFLLVSMELMKYSQQILNIRIKPSTLFLLSFIFIILLGTALLMLPEMTTQEGSMSFIDALFTSVSATCVTGLVVVDTPTFFTFKGHLVILMLMQFGGIGILSFASFFAFFLKSGVGIRHQTLVQDYLSEESLLNTRSLLQQIILFTLTFELMGTILIFSLWPPELQFHNLGEKLFYSVFHSVSAFCNAGFALFSSSLMEGVLAHAYVLHIAFAILIVLGGMGFPALRDLLGIRHLRERLQKPWKQWKTSTVIAVYSTALLIPLGAVLFYVLEQEYSLAGVNTLEAIIASFFQSVTTRTAGFNTVDIGALNTSTYILFIFLMFIGASSGGTGGGIKTSTFFLILLGARSTIRGQKSLQYRRRTIAFDLLNKAYSIFIFAASYILISIFVLSISEAGKDIIDLVFEAVSAFGTVGLSTGITPDLTVIGKTVIILSMYIGRVGTLTLAFALSSPVKTTAYEYPHTHMLVG